MTKTFLSVLASLVFSVALFAGNEPVVNGFVKINPSASKVEWLGKKVTGQHNGTVAIKDGQLKITDGMLTGGNITIDMTTIKNLDLQGETAAKLEGHLKSDDFFGVEKFPVATLIITESKSTGQGNFDVKANLTIKGITQPVNFKVNLSPKKNQYVAFADITIDRSKYDVRYGSTSFFDGLGDKAIYDNFDLSVSIVAE
jgi:polyisoprenoid-binding protein YceI